MSTLAAEGARSPLAVSAGPESLIVLSAGTARALDAKMAEVAGRLRRLPPGDLADAAYTLAIGPRASRHRCAVLCRSPEEAARLLGEPRSSGGAVADGRDASPVFVLPADVPDVERLAAEAAAAHSRFAKYHRACRRAGALRHGRRGAVFAFAYATARLWLDWGLVPRALYGSGPGEIAAACAGGGLGLARAVALLGGSEPPAGGDRRKPRIPSQAFESAVIPASDLVLRPGADSSGEALRRAWLAGVEPNWERVYEDQERRRIRLPALQRRRPPSDHGAAETVPWVLSAPSAAALRERADELRSSAERDAGRSPREVGWSLVATPAAGSGETRHRAVVLGRDREDFAPGLVALGSGRPAAGVIRGQASVTDGRIVFVYPGQGSQWRGMAADLLDVCPAFTQQAEFCADAFAPYLDWSLMDVLRDRPQAPSLERVDVVQPALFAVMVSLDAHWRSWGVRPDAVIGHSLGEMAAAYTSGALSLADAAAVVAHWSQAQATLVGAGEMASVELSSTALRDRLVGYRGRVDLAAINGPDWVLVSGDREDVVHLVAELTADGVGARLISVGLAAHSPHVDAITSRLMRDLASITPRATRVPFWSSMTGRPVHGAELDAAYWCHNLRGKVQFASTVSSMADESFRTFLELSPHPALMMGIGATLEAAGVGAESAVVGSLRRDHDGRTALLSALAELYVRGVPVDWTGAFGKPSSPGALAQAAPALPAGAVPEPEPEGGGPARRPAHAPRAEAERELLDLVGAHVAALCGGELEPGWADRSLGSLGFTSMMAVELRDRLAQDTGLRLPRTLVLDHPTALALSRFLAGELRGAADDARPPKVAQAPASSAVTAAGPAEPVAIVGMALRVPGARDLDEYWELLRSGREGIARLEEGELAAAGVPEQLLRDPGYVAAFGVLPDVELFDAAFFGMTPDEAQLTDPQHRLFLETCHSALEHAGCDAGRHTGRIGVFGGAGPNTYVQRNVSPADQSATSESFRVVFANDKDYLATRVAYKLDLTGPACSVQTACSTSLVAIHMACQALRAGECDAALAGGVSVRVPQARGHLYERGAILSADGHVRAFDAEASGTIFGNGAGVLALKRLADAVADGDTVHAVIRGTATNNDGAGKVSYAAPARDGQAAVIAHAQTAAGVDPRTITYLEAHGTGTALGDPVEVAALTQAFRRSTADSGYCAIGSVKPNIGHLDAAAGVAGVIKVALMMRHRTIVPSINYRRPNAAIDFDSTPFRVATELRSWTAEALPRRAGISSFGVGGTNAHAILEEAPERLPSGPARPDQLLLLSAATPSALELAAARLAAYLRRNPDVPLADVGYTLAVGRAAHRHRRALLCRDSGEAARLLEEGAAHSATTGYAPPAIAFAFPADGADEDGRLAGELAAAETAFAERYDTCAAAGALRHGPRGRAFAFQYALAGLWQHWGLQPEALFAEGTGELAAGCLAGALAVDEALAAPAGGRVPTGGGAGPRILPYGEADGFVVLPARAQSPLVAVRDAWLAGAEIDWEGFYDGQQRSRVPLPTYPFEGRRHWLSARPPAFGEAESPPDAAGHAIDAEQDCSAVTLAGTESYLADHEVHGKRVLPAAVHLELARAAGGSAVGACTIRDVAFKRMLSFDGGARTVRVRLEPRGSALGFTLTADRADAGDATSNGEVVYSRGELVIGDGAPAERIDLEAAAHRCPSRLEPATCYELLRERGLRHGASLRALREFAHRGSDEAVGIVEAPESAAEAASGSGAATAVLHPALLDGALQAAVCLLAASGEDGGVAYVPMRLGALHLHAALGRRCAVHVTRSADGADPGVVRVDVALAGEDGTVAVWLSDLVLRRLPTAARRPDARPAVAMSGRAPIFLRGHWSPSPLGPASAADGGPVLLLADSEWPRRALERALHDAGEPAAPVVLATPGSDFRRVDDRTYRVDPAHPRGFADLLQALHADGVAPRRILHAWTIAAQPDATRSALLDLGVGSLFHLTRALLARRPSAEVRLLFVHPLGLAPLRHDEALPVHEAVAAFARTARLENPALAYRIAGVASGALSEQMSVLLRELASDTGREPEVRYEGDLRLARRYGVVDPAADHDGAARLRDGGVYLITGGAGTLGLRVAEHLAARRRAKLVLVGRSALDVRTHAQIDALSAAGGTARYLQADVSREDDVRAVLAAIEAEHAALHGVVHAAAVLRDSFLVTKSPEDLWAVLAPKVDGTVHLDRLTAHQPLDFFVTFSSVVAPLGNVGQADYAFANGFMDAYMAHRERLVAAGQRSGTSLSIAWPLWQGGGMAPDEASAAVLERRLGSAALQTPVGLTAFETALGLRGGPVVVALGDAATVQNALSPAADVPVSRPEVQPGEPVELDAQPAADLHAVAERVLRELLAAETKLDAAAIDPQAPLDRYGIDSLLIVKLNSALEERFGELSKTLFFEYVTLAELAGYFTAHHAQRLSELGGTPPAARTAVRATAATPQAGGGYPEDAIAVIGLSGRYPMAADPDELWQNLVQGRDCVTEVPRDRWDHGRFFQDGPPAPGRAYTKWGGFLDDVDRFDPLFFGISPREAELMDPQERLLLQTAWHAVEDAGYRAADLAGGQVGVFIGAMYAEYQLYGAADLMRNGGGPVSASLHASIANRVSYALNLTGPSLAVDTMCSASLTAIHLACQSLRGGESELAIAGGVNLSLHPHKYVYLSQGRFASNDGRCRSFGEGGTGYVPGEGVGAVLLKPLARALADGDHIRGVILGDAINHGGRTNGYTVPNPNAQQRVIEGALRQARTDPGDIGYIEAHGTGTALGDPIEITALRKAFQALGREEPDAERRSCAIGSLKSNIGHLEAAAGIAGLTKVLLQLRHARLVPSLHAERLNPNIDFASSSFSVQRELADWEPPSGDGGPAPRRAALSSFGAGGSNAHLIVAEAPVAPPVPALPAAGQRTEEPLLYVLSARDEDRLREYAGRLGRFLRTERVDLADVAYTLRRGREPMTERLAVVSDDGAAVAEALLAFAEGAATPASLWHGTASTTDRGHDAARPDGDLSTSARLWVDGADLDEDGIAAPARTGAARQPRRVPLPGYPFARERYWLGSLGEPAGATGAAALHPLLDANESTLAEIRFRTTLRRDDEVLRDHEVAGRRLLAGTALLEMAAAAVERAAGRAPGRLRDVVWGRPVEVVEDTLTVFVGLDVDAGEDGSVGFEVFSEAADGRRVTHVRGRAIPGPADPPGRALDLAAVRGRCAAPRSGADIDGDYRRAGFDYGPSFQVMADVRIGTDEVLVEARLSEPQASAGGFTLHPALLDGLLRSIHWVNRRTAPAAGDLVVPFSLGEIEILAPLPPVCFAHAVPARGVAGHRPDAVERFDVVIVDEAGMELVRVHDLAGRPLPARDAVAPADVDGPLFYAFDWEPHAAHEAAGQELGSRDTLLVLAAESQPAQLLARSGRWSRVVRVAAGNRFHVDGDEVTVDPLNAHDLERLLAEVGGGAAGSGLDVVHLWDLRDGGPLHADGPEPGEQLARLDAAFGTGLLAIQDLLRAVHAAAGPGKRGSVRLLHAHVAPEGAGLPEHEAVAGLARGAEAAVPRLWFRSLRYDAMPEAELLARTVLDELAVPIDGPPWTAEVRYDDAGRRHLRRPRPARLPALAPGAPATAAPLRDRGVYLVTGGTGGLGLVFASYLAERHHARLVLLARSAPGEAARAHADRLTALGAEVLMVQGDVAVPADVRRALAETRARFGGLDGVFHAAGVYDPAPLPETDRQRFAQVLAAKTHGTVNLDVLTRDEPLDLFVLFSSVSTVLGDFGAGSYAAANRFLDAYAVRRDQWTREGRRHGRTLSLGWPLWSVGGVDSLLDDDELGRYRVATGMRPLSADEGLKMFERAWAYDSPVLVLAAGERARIEQALGVRDAIPAPRPAASPGGGSPDPLRAQVLEYLRARLAGLLKLPAAKLEDRTPLAQYGLDSVIVMEANALLAEDLPGLPGTLLFEYLTVDELTEYLIREHSGAVERLFGPPPAALASVAPSPRPAAARVVSSSIREAEDIAIVGLGGRYPRARDLDEFWGNLRSGRDCVGEVPVDRWDAEALFDPDPHAAGASYSRWGGFLDDVDAFDSLFFRISPMQARAMDPQERLFLETAWAALEDAGYTLDALPRPRFGAAGRDVGVFVGVMWGDYAVLAAEESFRGNHVTVPANRSSIANHVSYFGDFRGPSMVVDTACSSSLVALHLACESLRRGECSYAIAGGVNIAAHPAKYVHLSRMTMLAKDGRCRSFGAGGSGYVPGEGVGAVLLKPLSHAEADGDRIHAVIKASVVNQGGRTGGLTVPNPQAQQALVEEALHRAGIDARTIGYLEAHGTGTQLGDPIEHTGLERAFRTHTADRGFCALGSVKSAIGHLEGAAGIAGVTKAVLQLRHRQLVPSLHARELNPVIDFERSPFKVQRELADWPRPEAGDGGIDVNVPRRAGVSAFGAGGTNAHVILEEYLGGQDQPPAEQEPGRPELLLLSARSEDRLRAYSARLAAFLRRERANGRPPALADVAHTLQAGREAMAARLALTVRGLDEAAEALEAFARGEAGDAVILSTSHTDAGIGDLLTGVPEGRALVLALAAAGDYGRLGRLWASGLALDADLFQRVRPRPARRVSLPTYPFAPERHWIARRPAGAGAAAGQPSAEHRRTLQPAEPVVRDHVVKGRSILPAVAHLDFVLSALPGSDGGPRELEDVRWLSPVAVDGKPTELMLRTEPDDAGIRYEIRGGDGAGAVVHSRGVLRGLDSGAVAGADAVAEPRVEEIRARCPVTRTGAELYAALAGRGLRYGPYLQAIERVWTGDGEALGRLSLPAESRSTPGRHALHPAMADAALHTVAALLDPDDGVLVPFATARVRLLRPVATEGWSHVTALSGHRYDVTLLDPEGRVCVRFEDLACRALREPARPAHGPAGAPDDAYEQLSYRPRWAPARDRTADMLDGDGDAGDGVLIAAPESARNLALALGRAHLGQGADVEYLWLAQDGASADGVHRALAGRPAPGLVYFLGGTHEVSGDAAAREVREEIVALHRLVHGLRRAPAGGAGGTSLVRSSVLQLKVITTGAFPLGEDDTSRPWSAGLWGYCSVLDKEHPELQVAYLDVRDDEAIAAVPGLLGEPFPARAQAVSLRGGVRRTLRLEPVPLPPADGGAVFRDNGVYLILGGLGTVGYDTALHLAREHSAKLVLVGRSELDARRMAQVSEIERCGGEVLYVACDASHPTALAAAVTRAKQRFGALHGAIHSAMVLGTAPVRELDEASLHATLAAKADTTWNLARALWDEPLDFLLLYSSGVSFAGNTGQAGYAAGCTFADALAQHLARTTALPVRTVNWGYWHAGGDQRRVEALRRLVDAGIRPIGAREGMETVERFIASGLPRILATQASETILEVLGVESAASVRLDPRRAPSLPGALGAEPMRVEAADVVRIEQQRTASRSLDRLGQLLLLGAFQRSSALLDAGERRSVAELRRALGVVSRHHKLYDVLLDILALGELVRRDGDEVVVLPAAEGEEARQVIADPEAALDRLPADQPWTAAVAELLLRCTRALPDVLAGTTAATKVLFPGGSLDAVTAVYQGNPITDRLNAELAAVVRTYVEQRLAAEPAAQIRILEVGAGTGSTSGLVLEALAPFAERVRYTYTDISDGFVRHGRRRFGHSHPFADFRVLDIEGDLGRQEFAPGGYDVVLGTNVLHATRRIHRTVEQVKLLLRANGLLLVNEGTRADHAMTLIFGLMDGWWAFEDAEHRIPGTPLLSERSWRDVLHGCGFRAVVTHGLPQDGEVAQSLIVAERGAVVHAPAADAPERATSTAVADRRAGHDAPAHDYSAAERLVRQVFAEVLELAPDQLDSEATFENYGIDSLVVLQLNKALEQHVGRVPATLLFEQITIGRLARWLLAERPHAVDGAAPEAAPVADAPDLKPEAVPRAGTDVERLVGAMSDVQVEEMLRLLDPLADAATNGKPATR